MALHKSYEEQFFADYGYEENLVDINHKKKVKRMLEDKLERKRLREEFKDEFDEFDAEFDWDELDK